MLINVPTDRLEHLRRRLRVAREDLPAVLDVRAGDVHLDGIEARDVPELLGDLHVLLDAAARDRHDDARPALLEPGEVGLDEGVEARALETDGVEHAARGLGHPRGRSSGSRMHHDALRHDCAEVGDVEELVEFATRCSAPGRGEDRRIELHSPK